MGGSGSTHAGVAADLDGMLFGATKMFREQVSGLFKDGLIILVTILTKSTFQSLWAHRLCPAPSFVTVVAAKAR